MDSNLILGIILILGGFLLLMVELAFPSGAFLVLSLGSVLVGVFFVFLYNAAAGVVALLIVFVGFPLVLYLLSRLAPRTPMRHLLLIKDPEEETTLATTPMYQELEQFRGRFGKTLSTLRPAGVVDFDGRRVDALTEGMMVDAGQWVRCVDVKAGKVVVRPAEKPNLNALETTDFG
jgi:membrane-bound serine protease (ClpP class)